MGIDVVVENSHGEKLEIVPDHKGLFFPLISLMLLRGELLPVLQYTDEYGVTVFNQIQIPRFIDECNKLLELTETPDEKDFIGNVIKVAERTVGKPHVYIKLNGD